MLLQDTQRNAAYERAINRAVQFLRASGHEKVTALDIGVGSGLLSMMAARCCPLDLLCSLLRLSPPSPRRYHTVWQKHQQEWHLKHCSSA